MRLIDADALQEQLAKKEAPVCAQRYTDGFNDALLRFKSMIHAAPTIQPRVKGKWVLSVVQSEEDVLNGNYCYDCSNCHMSDIHAKTHEVSFCWNCGADMRGETYEIDNTVSRL